MKPTKWEEYLHLVEFVYNNGYQTSTKMSPFKVLCDRKCTTPISWDDLVERLMMGPKMLQGNGENGKKGTTKLKRGTGQTKKLHRFEKETPGIPSWGSHVFEIQSKEKLTEARELCKVGAQVLWPLRDLSSNWTHGISTCTPCKFKSS
jgi:hypothetical protein